MGIEPTLSGWERAQHHFANDAKPIPVQVISSEADFRLRDPEAEADRDQVTVVVNLWYSKKTIHAAIEDLLNERRAHWPTGDAHEDWHCEDFIVRAYRQPQALDNIYNVMKFVIRDGWTTRQIADETLDDESAVRRTKKRASIYWQCFGSRYFQKSWKTAVNNESLTMCAMPPRRSPAIAA